MTLRRLIFLAHRYVGLAIALLLGLAAMSGTILAFRDPLDAALNPDLFTTSATSTPIPATMIAERLLRDHPDWTLRRLDLASRPGMALRAMVMIPHQQSSELFLDPASGTIIGQRVREGGLDRRHILQGLHFVHTHLGFGPAGRWIMGSVAAAWTLATLLGLFITLPRRRPFLARWQTQWRTTGPMLRHRPMPELHRVIGLWTLPFLLGVSASAFGMSFFNDLTKPLLETLSPPRAHSPLAAHKTTHHHGMTISPQAALEAADRWAAQARPGDRAIALSTTASGFYGLTYTPDGTLHPKGLNRRTCYIDGQTGEVTWIDDPLLDGPGTIIQRALHPLHTWQIAGSIAPFLASLGGIATFALSLTGLWPWARRTLLRIRRRQSRNRQRAAPVAAPPDLKEAA